MSRIVTRKNFFMLALVLVGFCAATVLAAEPNEAQVAREKVKAMSKKAKVVKLEEKAAEGAVEVDLFKAIEDDQIQAGVVQGNMKGGKLFIQNKTDKPISVRMPSAFGTRPVLGQNMGGGNTNQILGNGGMGGGMGDMGGGMGGGMGGMGMMNVPAEAVVAVSYKSVCLEYGKKEPTSGVAYEIAPIDEVTDKEEVKILCNMLGQVDGKAAQFAAWHMASGTSVEHLASETVLHVNGVRTTNFSQQEVQAGLQLIQYARQTAAENAMQAVTAPSDSSSSEN